MEERRDHKTFKMTHKWTSAITGIAMALRNNFSFDSKDKMGRSIPPLSEHKGTIRDRPANVLCAEYVPGRGTGSPLTNMTVQGRQAEQHPGRGHQTHKAARDEGFVLG